MRTPTATKIRAIHYGVGSVGAEVVRLVLDRPYIDSVAAVDPQKAGLDLGEVVGVDRRLGSTVAHDPESVLTGVDADVVFHTGEAALAVAYPQIMRAVTAGKNVISNCAELAFPWFRHPDIARNLDQRAREAGVAILGVGANPGFAMDAVFLLLATACRQIRSVRITRVVDITPRALELRHEVGIGLTPEGFAQVAGNGSGGIPGLRESLLMIAHTMGWRLDDIRETLEPIIARRRLRTDYFLVDKGYVQGLRHTVSAVAAGREIIRLELEISLEAENPRDELVVEGKPPIRVSIPGGQQDDQATAAIMVNCVPAVVRRGMSGLLSIRDMPLAPYYSAGASMADSIA